MTKKSEFCFQRAKLLELFAIAITCMNFSSSTFAYNTNNCNNISISVAAAVDASNSSSSRADDSKPPLSCYHCSYWNQSKSSGQSYCEKMDQDNDENRKYLEPADGDSQSQLFYVYCVVIRGKDSKGNTIYVERKSESSRKEKPPCEYGIPKGNAAYEHLGAEMWSTCRCDNRDGCNDDGLIPNGSRALYPDLKNGLLIIFSTVWLSLLTACL